MVDSMRASIPSLSVWARAMSGGHSYEDDLLGGLTGTIHEAGHGMYEQGLPGTRVQDWPPPPVWASTRVRVASGRT